MERTLKFVNSLGLVIRRSFYWPETFFLQPHEPIFVDHVPQLEGTNDEEDEKSKGFLWGVPKKRRTVERRAIRKYGDPEFVWKMIRKKTNIRICDNCGNHYEAKHLCRHCYDKVIAETKIIRDAATSQLGDSPEDKSIVVLYENELQMQASQALNGEDHLIVEIAKPRPTFFSQNLLQKTTAGVDRVSTAVTQDSTTITPKVG